MVLSGLADKSYRITFYQSGNLRSHMNILNEPLIENKTFQCH